MVNMDFVDNYAPYSGGATAINNTGVVNDASYNFNLAAGGIGGAGMAEVVSGGTNPNDLMAPPIISNPLPSMSGGGRRRKKSRRLKRSNKTRLNSRSKKSKSRSKVNKVRRSLSKRNRKIKRKSKRSKRSKRSLR
jgi:hypothetical protein